MPCCQGGVARASNESQCCQGFSDGPQDAAGGAPTTKLPVRYMNGEVGLVVADLASGGPARGWGHTRAYSNKNPQLQAPWSGESWFVKQHPQVMEPQPSDPGSPPATLMASGVPCEATWFNQVQSSGSSSSSSTLYEARFFVKDRLEVAGDGTITVTSPEGWRSVFHPLSDVTKGGRLDKTIDPYGNTHQVTYDSAGRVETVLQETPNGDKERYEYAYHPSGPNAGQLQSVTLSEQRGSSASTVTRKVEYEYYDGSAGSAGVSTGSLNDLKRVTTYDYGTGSETEVGKTYYRYYRDGDTDGFPHALKFIVGPEAYQRLVAAVDEENIQELPDFAETGHSLSAFADNYFEYDSEQRVRVQESNGGTLRHTYEYAQNPSASSASSSSLAAEQNTWTNRTIETLPNGCENVVYCNAAGQVMLKVFRTGSSSSASSSTLSGEWYEYTRYDAKNRPILQTKSSAVQSWSEADPWLVTLNSGGFARYSTYYADTDAVAPGYLESQGVQQGDNEATRTKQHEWEYTAPVGVPLVSAQTAYFCENDQSPATTNYSYLFHAGTVQVKQRRTQLPGIPDGENGAGLSVRAERYEEFDPFGRLTWQKDEMGSYTRHQYDALTGGLLQVIRDVDLSLVDDVPDFSGFSSSSSTSSSSSSTGLHLVTDYEVDAQGRMVQELGPVHDIVLDGVATPIRRARWVVYKDSERQRWEGAGYATQGNSSAWDTFTLIDPVSLTFYDNAGRVTDQVQARRSSPSGESITTAGKLTAQDSFPRENWVRWTQNHYNDQSQQDWQRVYHDIPASSSSSSSGSTCYAQTSFAYDDAGRQYKVTAPGGTITQSVFDAAGRLAAKQVGTDDSGGSSDNMRVVEEYEYDEGQVKQDGNVSRLTRHAGDYGDRVTHYYYDWRNRVMRMVGEEGTEQTYDYCNLDTRTKTTAWASAPSSSSTSSSTSSALWCKKDFLDLRGRVYQRRLYPGEDGTGNPLVDNFWYDPAGRLIKEQKAGSHACQKTKYDALGRPLVRYLCYNLTDYEDPQYDNASNVSQDVVVRQEEMAYDAAGNVIQRATRERFHDEDDTEGELGGPNG